MKNQIEHIAHDVKLMNLLRNHHKDPMTEDEIEELREWMQESAKRAAQCPGVYRFACPLAIAGITEEEWKW